MNILSSKLILGTAQFGSKYGISNINKRAMSFNEIKNILNFAQKNNILSLDTAASYGNCEEKLGYLGVSDFKVISKLSKISSNLNTINEDIINNVLNSLNKLKSGKLYGIHIHYYEKKKSTYNNILLETLIELKAENLIEKIGVSIYDKEDIFYFKDFKEFDIIQVPYNVFDNRFLDKKINDIFIKNNIEIHARSIFLQGLLLMKKKNIPKQFLIWNKLFNKWFDFLEEKKIDPVSACLLNALSKKEFSKILVGVDNVSQFENIIRVIKNNDFNFDVPNFDVEDLRLINPYMWNKLLQ